MRVSIENSKVVVNGIELKGWKRVLALILAYLSAAAIMSGVVLFTLAVLGVTTVVFIPVLIAVFVIVGVVFLVSKL